MGTGGFAGSFGEDEEVNAEALIVMAIDEDLSEPIGDLTTTATIPADARGAARIVARSAGVACGFAVVDQLVRGLPDLLLQVNCPDGTAFPDGATLARLAGPMGTILAYERIVLNFLQRLSAIATLSGRYVDAVAGTKATILDTRKTTPGWRALEKYAVRCGGGTNHRIGLFDAVLIKDNHLAALAEQGVADPIAAAVEAGRRVKGAKFVEVEVDSLDQLDRALAARPDIVLVDNATPAVLAEAVRRRDLRAPGVLIEASGGVNLDTVAAIARAGVDRISVGAITHSAGSLDIGLDYEPQNLS